MFTRKHPFVTAKDLCDGKPHNMSNNLKQAAIICSEQANLHNENARALLKAAAEEERLAAQFQNKAHRLLQAAALLVQA